MSETWVLLFWVMMGGNGAMSATSQQIVFDSEAACRASVAEIYSTLDDDYHNNDSGFPQGVHALCLRTDAPDPNAGQITVDEMNRRLQSEQSTE